MSSLLLLIIVVPLIEIMIMIEVGQNLGVLNTLLAICLTAILGLYFARLQGISTLRSGLVNIYKNKSPAYELFSGASIAVAALFLIVPGFATDFIGFILLVPFTRKILIKLLIKNKNIKNDFHKGSVIDGEVVSKNENDKDEV